MQETLCCDLVVKTAHLKPAILGDRTTVEVDGVNFLLGEGFNKRIGVQKQSQLVSALITSAMMQIGEGSPAAGLWSMMPNLLPLFRLASSMNLARGVTNGGLSYRFNDCTGFGHG